MQSQAPGGTSEEASALQWDPALVNAGCEILEARSRIPDAPREGPSSRVRGILHIELQKPVVDTTQRLSRSANLFRKSNSDEKGGSVSPEAEERTDLDSAAEEASGGGQEGRGIHVHVLIPIPIFILVDADTDTDTDIDIDVDTDIGTDTHAQRHTQTHTDTYTHLKYTCTC